MIEKFGRKLGQNLREITFIEYKQSIIKKYKKLLRLSPNLVSFGDKFGTDLSLFVDKNELLVPKLSKVKIREVDIQVIKTLVNNYKNSLKTFSISLKENTNVLMQQIIDLKNLNRLELRGFVENPVQVFVENLKAIAINCNQLNHLRFTVSGSDSLLINKEIFECLGFFKNLKHLDLFLAYEESNQIRCQSLKELKLLTHLIISRLVLNDIFFEDIDKHLPQLKHLQIEVYNNITDKAMNSLSKLQKLQSIKIESNGIIKNTYWFIMPFVTDSGLIDLINNCPQINSIELNCRPNISHQTIDALIGLALRKPLIQFQHHFGLVHGGHNSMTVIDLNSFQFPNNLFITHSFFFTL